MKSRMHIPTVSNLFFPESQGQSVGRRLRMLGLIASLALLVFAAMGLASTAAAQDPVVIADANPDMAELDRLYGTYTSQWNGIVDRELGAASHRNYGTYTSQWNGIVARELGASPAPAPHRKYGTFAGVWYTDFPAR